MEEGRKEGREGWGRLMRQEMVSETTSVGVFGESGAEMFFFAVVFLFE